VRSSGQLDYRIGSAEELTKVFGDEFGKSYRFPLRTNVKQNNSVSVEENDLVKLSEK
jgi:hypothetical protein